MSKAHLPEVAPPCLKDLHARVEAAPLPSGDDLVRRLHEILRGQALRTELPPGQTIELGDEVDCDILPTLNGRLVVSMIARTPWLEVREMDALPGLIEGLVGMAPHSCKAVTVTVSESYPDRELRGKSLSVLLEVRGAARVAMPELDDPEALERAGLGQNLDQAMATVADLVDTEQGEELLADATEVVLDALAQRVIVDLPAELVDQELALTWQKGIGAILQDKPIPDQVRQAAFKDFMSEPILRLETERRLKVSLGLASLIRQEGLAPKPEIVQSLLEAAALTLDSEPDELKHALAAEPDEARRVAETALHLTAVEYVMARATVEVLDPANG